MIQIVPVLFAACFLCLFLAFVRKVVRSSVFKVSRRRVVAALPDAMLAALFMLLLFFHARVPPSWVEFSFHSLYVEILVVCFITAFVAGQVHSEGRLAGRILSALATVPVFVYLVNILADAAGNENLVLAFWGLSVAKYIGYRSNINKENMIESLLLRWFFTLLACWLFGYASAFLASPYGVLSFGAFYFGCLAYIELYYKPESKRHPPMVRLAGSGQAVGNPISPAITFVILMLLLILGLLVLFR